MSKRSYSDNQKAAALLTLETNGGNVARTARETGIPRKTIEEWSKGQGVTNDVAEIRRENRPDLLALLKDELYAVMELMPEKRANADYKDLARTMGILVDKIQLLAGEPTQRNVVDMTLRVPELPEDTLDNIFNGQGA